MTNNAVREEQNIKPNHDAALDFIQSWPGATVHLNSKHPDRDGMEGQTFNKTNVKGIRNWLAAAHARGRNVWFSVNGLVGAPKNPKASEAEVGRLYAYHVDADVDKSITDPVAFEIAKADLLERIKKYQPTPSVVVDSGNGFGVFWVLAKPVSITDENRTELKARNVRLRDDFKADACQDLCRIMRLPGTVNMPDAVKRKRGRVPVLAKLVMDDWPRVEYTVDCIEPASSKLQEPADAAAVYFAEEFDINELESTFRELIVDGPREGQTFGDGSRSDYSYHVAAELRRQGRSNENIVWVLTNPTFAAAAHILDQKQREPEAQASRTIAHLDKMGVAPLSDAFDDADQDLAPEEAKQGGTTRPVVMLKVGSKPFAARQVKKYLIEDTRRQHCAISDKLFRRGSEVVHLNRNKLTDGEKIDKNFHVAEDLLICNADKYWFGDRAERAIRFMRVNKEGETVPAEPPEKLLNRVCKIITPVDFAPLLATTETPTLRADGSLLSGPGYDAMSGLFYDPGRAVFPDIPKRPTKAQALEALELFTGERGILKDFPFADDPSEPKGLSLSVALAALLTPLVRRSIPTAPLFAIDANEAQSGKTLLASVAGTLATGRCIAVRPWPTDEYQRINALAMALETGEPVLIYDNLGPDAPIEGDCLNAIITNPTMRTRRLGSNSGLDEINVPTNVTIICTGNHIVVRGDMAEGRTLVTRIIPDRPLSSRIYLYRDLLGHILEQRPQLIAAGLTILRAYEVARDKLPPTKFRLQEWGDRVAAPIAWLGLPNPTLAEQRAQSGDPERELQEKIVRAWAKEFRTARVDMHQLLANTNVTNLLKDALGCKNVHEVTWQKATPYLRKMVGVLRAGFKLQRHLGDGHNTGQTWWLEAVDIAAKAAIAQRSEAQARPQEEEQKDETDFGV